MLNKGLLTGWAVVAHTCNSSYSGGRDQEDQGSKSALGKQFERPYLGKKPSQKSTGRVVQGVCPEFKPQYGKNKTKQNKKTLEDNRAAVFFAFCFFFLVVLGLELRAYTLSHSTSPIFVKGFCEIGSGRTICPVGFKLKSS
jgi:hypothetical protein